LRQGEASLRGIARSIVTNPAHPRLRARRPPASDRMGLPPGLGPTLRALGQASLPLGLLCVGAAFDVLALRHGAHAAAVATLAKFGLLPSRPSLSASPSRHGDAASVAMLFQALPTATSAYILARHLGGDAPLMAGIVALQTLVAALAIPLALLAALTWLGP
jgi:predicted permease